MAIIGIDLGTTNSLGAVYRNGKVELIPNRLGSFLTPSVVSVMEDGSVLVGQIAKERLISHPECTAASFKKDMGTDRKYKIGGKTFLPEELSSLIVRSIVEDAAAYLGEEIEEAIISVPAYFHDKQRVATKRAGALAGIEVKRIINEPSAAAMASYFDTSVEQLFLVFDFGGGTLDVSIVDCFDTMVEIVSVAGDNRLGGDDFHETMAESFLSEHNLMKKQISDKEYAILLRQAEICKRKLSEEESAKMTAVIGGQTFQSIYTNERLVKDSPSILMSIKKVLSRAIQDGGLTIRNIDAIVLAGGSSKMPLIQSYLKHLFGQIPMIIGDCDELIARGLGLVCAVKARQEDVKDFVLTDICPFSLGMATLNEADPLHSYMCPIVERNTVLPCSRVKQFNTVRDNQKEIEIEIIQGEHLYAEDNLLLGKLNVAVPPNKQGEEVIDVRFTYDLNGILIVDVTVVSTGQVVSKVLSQQMDDKEMHRRIKQLEKLKVHPKDVSENKLVMEKLQALFEEVQPDLREQIQEFIQYFEYLLSKQEPRKIKRYRAYLEQVIGQFEAYDPFAPAMVFPEFQEDESEENGNEDNTDDAKDDDIFKIDYDGGNDRWTS